MTLTNYLLFGILVAVVVAVVVAGVSCGVRAGDITLIPDGFEGWVVSAR